MKHLLLAALSSFCLGSMHAQTLVINELMQSNIDCVMDDLNEFPDSWVELYNAGSTAVNLQSFSIGTTDKADNAWQLPDKMVAAKQYVLVYCDKEEQGFHTPWRLESGKGCSVYLFQDGIIVDHVEGMKKQPAPNIAYGRKTDGGNEWGYQLTATPNATNCGQLAKNMLGEPVFSKQGVVVTNTNNITVQLSLPEGSPEGSIIRYTLNGAEPTANSALYNAPFVLNRTTIIRAKVFCDGYLSPRSTCHSYIFFPTTRPLTLPVVSIMTDNRYLNDSKIGIYVDGNYQSGKKNYEFDWRRPINIELFEGADQQSVINQLGETRIMGGATRSNKMKSLAVYAHKRFGTKRLDYEFFPDQKPGMKDFKSIALRNAGNDFDYLYQRDAVIQRTMATHADLDWQAWRPVIVYINGAYKGMLNIRERSNDDYVYTNYDGLEDIDMFENWDELKEGDWENYNLFKAFYNEHGHTLAEYAEWMDWEEFINLMAMNLYYNNQDFPGNNIVMWRPKAEGGKWRWIAKDTDFGLGLYGSPADYKTLEWLYNPNYDAGRNWANKYEHTRLFRRLMEDADFNREFIDRCCIYMGDFMNEKGTREIWDPMYEAIKTEYPYHRRLINQWWPNYNDELNAARNWLKKRTAEFYKQIGSYYQLGMPYQLIINKGNTQQVDITVNGIKLSENEMDGNFFANRSLHISGKATEGQDVKGWKVTAQTTTEIVGSELDMTMPAYSVTITPIVGEASGIMTLTLDEPIRSGTLYDLTGQRVESPQKGRIYIRNGRKTVWP